MLSNVKERDLKVTTSGTSTRSSRSVNDDAALLSRILPTNWRTWNVPRYTSRSMRYGVSTAQASSDVAGEEDHYAYEELLDALECSNDVLDLSIRNSWLTSILAAVTFNPWYCNQNEDDRGFRMRKLNYVINVIIALLLRWYNGRCWVLNIVILSLWALKCHVPTPFWSVLGKWKLLYSKQTTEMIATDLGRRAEIFPAWASRAICIAVFDNCLIKFNTSYEGIRSLGDGSRPYLFINWFIIPIKAEEVPISLQTLSSEGFLTSVVFMSETLLNI